MGERKKQGKYYLIIKYDKGIPIISKNDKLFKRIKYIPTIKMLLSLILR
jgi:hypothetical protein